LINTWNARSLRQPLPIKLNIMTRLSLIAEAAVVVAEAAAVEVVAAVAAEAIVFKIFGNLLFLLSNFVFQGTIEDENLKERTYL